MRKTFHFFVALAISLLGPAYFARASFPAVGPPSAVTGEQQLATASSVVYGWEFSVAADMDVTQLGWFDHNGDGLVHDHAVGIWRANGTPLIMDTVPAGAVAPLHDSYRYIDVAPLRLHAGQSYVVGGLQPRYECLPVQPGCHGVPPDIVEGTQFLFDLAILDYDAVGAPFYITIVESRYRLADTGEVQYPTNIVASDSAFLGPTFAFQSVPEPSTLTHILAACLFACLCASLPRLLNPGERGIKALPRLFPRGFSLNRND